MVSRETLGRAITGGVAAAALTMGGVGLSAASASAAPRNPWNAIAQCESGGNWHIDTGNGYYGGLQFSASTWAAHGGRGSAASASKAEQIAIGKRVAASQGWGAWSSCSARLGLSGRADFTVSAVSKRLDRDRSRRVVVESVAGSQRDDDRRLHGRHAKRDEQQHHRAHAKRDEQHRSPRHAAVRAGRHAAEPAVSKATYTVKSGDTLQAIATRLHVEGGWQALADANTARLAHPSQIHPGQVLRLPAK